MARFDADMRGAVALEEKFKKLGVALDGEIAGKVLEAGAKAVQEDWQQAAKSFGYISPGKSGRGTGKMIESIGYGGKSPSAIGRVGSVDIYPQGSRKRGKKRTRNAEIAFILHYGRLHMPGSFWVDKADDLCDRNVYAVMQDAFDREVGRVAGE